MELLLTKEAQEMLQRKKQADEQFVLDIEDGEGPFTDSQISCQLYTSFRLILVKNDTAEDLSLYSEEADTPIGTIKIKQSALMYMDNPTTIAVEPTYQSLQLKGPSGLLKSNLQVVRKDEKS